MKCEKCDTEMVLAELFGAGYPSSIFVRAKKKGFFDTEKRSGVKCFVCPECGKIELYAEEPKKFKCV